LAYIVGVCWGNCTKLFHMMCPYRGIKISASDFGGSFFSKMLGPKNLNKCKGIIRPNLLTKL